MQHSPVPTIAVAFTGDDTRDYAFNGLQLHAGLLGIRRLKLQTDTTPVVFIGTPRHLRPEHNPARRPMRSSGSSEYYLLETTTQTSRSSSSCLKICYLFSVIRLDVVTASHTTHAYVDLSCCYEFETGKVLGFNDLLFNVLNSRTLQESECLPANSPSTTDFWFLRSGHNIFISFVKRRN